jgi:hypothetical protein
VAHSQPLSKEQMRTVGVLRNTHANLTALHARSSMSLIWLQLANSCKACAGMRREAPHVAEISWKRG